MPLIVCDRHSPADLAAWERAERLDRVRAVARSWPAREARAMQEIERFFEAGPGYVGTSWGKDSVVVAHLARRVDPGLPLVWVRRGGGENPHCASVRDAFLDAHPGGYDEVQIGDARLSRCGAYMDFVDEQAGYTEAGRRHGARYVSGVRAEESGARKLRVARGLTLGRTCAPIGRWSGDDVFAYLHRHSLPAHPAYAMTRGGLLDRQRIRVAWLGGRRGTGMGRREWEWHYYGPEMHALGVSRDASAV